MQYLGSFEADSVRRMDGVTQMKANGRFWEQLGKARWIWMGRSLFWQWLSTLPLLSFHGPLTKPLLGLAWHSSTFLKYINTND